MIRLRGFAASARQVLLLSLLLGIASPVEAQSRFEIGGGVTWTGGYDAGGTDAELSRPPSGSTPLTLFSTSSRMDGSAGAVARLAFFVRPRLVAEGFAEYSRPTLRTAIANDVENATGTEATLAVASIVIGGSVRYSFGRGRLGRGRLAPFVSAGAGWLRQIDDEQTSVMTGAELHAGGGIIYGLSAHLRLRVDAGISSRDKSLAVEAKRRTLPIAGASLSYRF